MTKSNKINIKPLSDNVLVRPIEAETKTASGIVLPDSAKEKPQIGQVMATGPGSVNPEGKLIVMNVKIGQKVMYKKWGGDEVKVGNEEWMMVKQGDILAVIDG